MLIEVDRADVPVQTAFTDPETLAPYRVGNGGPPAQRPRAGLPVQPLLEVSALAIVPAGDPKQCAVGI